MGSDVDSSGSDAVHTLPLESLPLPAVGYEHASEGPTIAVTNGRFERRFEQGYRGEPVQGWLERDCGVDEATARDCCATLADGDSIETEVEGTESAYRLRSVESPPERGRVDGYLVVTELDRSGAGEIGVDPIASVISHDLRNPLDVAKAHLRAAREHDDGEHLERVAESHDRIERIIQDVLTVARGENALQTVEAVAIESVAADAWATVETADATLEVDSGLPTVEGDPDRLQRLFENLFRNSVEHALSGVDADRTLAVRVSATENGFSVADNGVGIPPAERSRVFGSGYTAGHTGGGTGLGLTIVEGIATAHGWTVSLTDGPMEGACFSFDCTPD